MTERRKQTGGSVMQWLMRVSLMMKVVVHSADMTDRDGARQVPAEISKDSPRLKLVWADKGYRGAEFKQRTQRGLPVGVGDCQTTE